MSDQFSKFADTGLKDSPWEAVPEDEEERGLSVGSLVLDDAGDLPYSSEPLAKKEDRSRVRSVTDPGTNVLSKFLSRGIRKRGSTTESTSAPLHKKASISVPTLPASEFVNEASVLSCVLSMTNSVVGAGILTFPYCFSKMGVIPGLIVILCGAGLQGCSCFLVMVAAKTVSSGSTFSDLGWKTIPRVMKVVDILNFIGSFGSLVAYLIVIGDLAPDAFKHIADSFGGSSGSFFVGRTFMISMYSLVFLFPMIPVKQFDNLKYDTMFAMCCYTCVVVVVILFAFVPSLRNDLHDKVDTGDGLYMWSHSGGVDFTSVFAIIMLSFSSTQNSVPVAHELKNNTVKRLGLVCTLAFLLCASFYAIVGIVGFSSFGNDTESDILLNYSNHWLVTVVRIFLSVAMASSYRCWHHPCRENVSFLLLQRSAFDEETTRFQYLAITYGIWVVSYMISLFVNNLGAVMGLIGSVGVTACVYSVPGLLFYYRCTPAGGPEFYSATGTVDANNARMDDTRSVAQLKDDSTLEVERTNVPSVEYMDETAETGLLSEAVAVGDKGVTVWSSSELGVAKGKEWDNVWPPWMSHVALFYGFAGIILIPFLLTIQILALK